MSIRDVFSKRLRALRKEIGISQEAFAEALGVARATLGYYEKGERLPDIEFLDLVCDKTGCSMGYLMGHSDNMKPSNEAIGSETGLSDGAIEALMCIHVSLGSTMLNHLIEHRKFGILLVEMTKISACSGNVDPDFPSDRYIDYKLFQAAGMIREICQSINTTEEGWQLITSAEQQKLIQVDGAFDSLIAEIKALQARQEDEKLEREKTDPVFRFRRRMKKGE